MSPLVSVILPTYNRATTLARAVESVLNQTFADFELVIIDDGSTDGTRELLGKYAGVGKVRIIWAERRGAGGARNLGVSQARGVYIAFQDSDDEWVPHKLARAMEVLTRPGEECSVFYSNMTMYRFDGRVYVHTPPVVTEGRFFNERTGDYEVSGISMQTLVLKKAHYEAVGGCDEVIPRFIDMELCIRLGDHYRFVHCAESLCNVYHGQESFRISTNLGALIKARQYMIRKYRKRLARSQCDLARQDLYLAHAHSCHGDTLRSVLTAVRAWVSAPTQMIIIRGTLSALRREVRRHVGLPEIGTIGVSS